MVSLRNDIKNNEFKQYYLLMGNEQYLKRYNKKLLIDAIVDKNDEMNFSSFNGKDIELSKVVEIGMTLPFFSERRLILIENSLLFKNSNNLSDMLVDMPKSSIFVFIEEEVDKRGKLYKKINKEGRAITLDSLNIDGLKKFVLKILYDNKKKITESNLIYLIDRVGSNMDEIVNETMKLISYLGEKEAITKEDIKKVVVNNINNSVFKMIDYIANKDKNRAVDLYYELVLLKEEAMLILHLINRQFNILLKIKDLNKRGFSNSAISKELGLPPFVIDKNLRTCNKFTYEELKRNFERGITMDERIKSGDIQKDIGLDILIVQLSS